MTLHRKLPFLSAYESDPESFEHALLTQVRREVIALFMKRKSAETTGLGSCRSACAAGRRPRHSVRSSARHAAALHASDRGRVRVRQIPGSAITTALALLVVGALALPYLAWNDIRNEFRHPMSLAGLAFVASALLSTIASTDLQTSLYGHYENFTGFVTIIAYFILFVAAKALLRTSEQIQSVLLAVVFAAIGVTVYGLLQTSARPVYLGIPPESASTSAVSTWGMPTILPGW
jgi:hypothetical protein